MVRTLEKSQRGYFISNFVDAPDLLESRDEDAESENSSKAPLSQRARDDHSADSNPWLVTLKDLTYNSADDAKKERRLFYYSKAQPESPSLSSIEKPPKV